jgi:hypothetical protein
LRRGRRRRRFGGWCRWPDGLLDAGLSFCGLAFVVLIRRDLLLGPKHGDRDLAIGFVDQVLVGKGGKASGDNLHANCTTGRDDVDHRLTVGVGLDLQIALILTVQSRTEDNRCVADGLAVELFHYCDFNVRSGWRGFVFATAAGGGVLCHGGQAGNQGHGEEKSELGDATQLHGVILRRFEGVLSFRLELVLEGEDLRDFHSDFTLGI